MPDNGETVRTAILNRIRAANSGAPEEKCDEEYASIDRAYQAVAGMDREHIVAMFLERLREYDASAHVTDIRNLHKTISDVFAAYGQQSVIAATGFPLEWISEEIRCRTEASASVDALSSAEGAITTCEVAIAHTGTIVIRDSRRMTLLPDRLLCVAREDQLVETVPEAMARLQLVAACALTFISGPSATADIEMTRIRGVHGPRFLDVVLVRDQPADDQIAPSG